jgi:hypothetical protein
MAIKYIVDTLEEIPEAVREHYTETGGKWILDCEGAAPQAKVEEFRTNNIALKRDLEKFKDVDPDKYKELLQKEEDFEAGNAKTKEEIEAAVEKRVEKLKTESETKIKKLEEDNGGLVTRLTDLQINQAVISTAGALGMQKGADSDIVARAKGVWKLVDGEPVAFDEKGEEIFGREGKRISMREWAEGLTKSAPHLFDPNAGSGAGGGGGGGGNGDTGVNPWKKETFNLTEQGKIFQADPAKARRLAAAAGATIRA